MFMFRNVSRMTPFVVLAALSISPALAGDPFTLASILRLAIAPQKPVRLPQLLLQAFAQYSGYKHHS